MWHQCYSDVILAPNAHRGELYKSVKFPSELSTNPFLSGATTEIYQGIKKVIFLNDFLLDGNTNSS